MALSIIIRIIQIYENNFSNNIKKHAIMVFGQNRNTNIEIIKETVKCRHISPSSQATEILNYHRDNKSHP